MSDAGRRGAGTHLVYIVEDDDEVRSSTRALLEASGYRVQEFANAEQVLEAGGADEAGCIVLDYNLSGMTGLELVERLRLKGVSAPAIIVSANGKPLLDRAAQLGIVAVLRKPMAAEALEQWLEQILPARR